MNSNLRNFTLLVWAIALLSSANFALALTSCNVSSAGFANGYVPANPGTSITSTTFTVTCTRDNAGGPVNATVQYELTANNGVNPLGTQNRAALAGSFLNYNLATDATCATPWKGATVIPVPTGTFPIAKNSTVSASHTFYGCIPPGQLALPPEGIYTDTVTMTFSLGKVTGTSAFTGGSIPVNIIAPATCNITAPPSNLAFAYTSFSPTVVLANSTFGVSCTTSLTYTISLDAVAGVIAGVNYALALNTVANGGVNPLPAVGTGIPQTFFINGSLAAGQSGTCTAGNCSGSQVRTLTITY